MHPAVDDDFVVSRNAPYGQVLVLASQRLVHPESDDEFVALHVQTHCMDKCLCCQAVV